MSSSAPEKPTSGDQPPPYEANQQPPAYPQQSAPAIVYPPPPGAGAYGATTTTIVTNQPAVVLPIAFGPLPMSMTCPNCRAAIVTSTNYEPGVLTWLVCGGIALVGCWCGCCFIPFCVNDMQDCRHSCPNCKQFLGVYRRI